MLTQVLDNEKANGSYPITLAALSLFEKLFASCPVALWTIKWSLQGRVSLSGADRWAGLVGGTESRSVCDRGQLRSLDKLLHYVFGVVFARHHCWPFQNSAERWRIARICVSISDSVTRSLKVFNWQASQRLRDFCTRDSFSAYLGNWSVDLSQHLGILCSLYDSRLAAATAEMQSLALATRPLH